MGAAYQLLHQQAVASVIDWVNFQGAVDLLISGQLPNAAMNDFFSNATGISQVLVGMGRFQHADTFWGCILKAVESAEITAGAQRGGYNFWAGLGCWLAISKME